MNMQLKKTSLAVAVISALGINNVFAQDSSNEESKEDANFEVIEIQGFKASLVRSINNKRFAEGVTDSIYAEDIGKSTDQNIAEALSRVTGVSLSRTDGEGTSISIRGAGPSLNNISLNGISLTSPGASNTVDLSAFSSDILSRIEINKTSSADQDEGSLGGGVVLHTFRPLDAKENLRSIEIQHRYHDLAKTNDHKLSGSFSHKFLDDTLGIVTTLFDETQTIRKDQVSMGGLDRYQVRSDQVVDQNGNPLTRVESDGQGGEVIQNFTGIGFGSASHEAYINQRNRQGGTLGIQYQPTDSTNIQFDASYSVQTTIEDKNSFSFTGLMNNAAESAVVDIWGQEVWDANPPASDPLRDWHVFDTELGMFTKFLSRNGFGRVHKTDAEVDSTNTILGLDIEQRLGDFTLNLRAGRSKTDVQDEFFLDFNTINGDYVSSALLYGVSSSEIEPVGYDCSDGKCRTIVGQGLLDSGDGDPTTQRDNFVTTGLNPHDLNGRYIQQVFMRNQAYTDTADSVFFDVDWDVDAFGITQVEFGYKYSSREKDLVNQTAQFNGNNQNNVPSVQLNIDESIYPSGISGIPLTEIHSGDLGFNNFLSGLGYADDVVQNWPTLDARKAYDIIFGNAPNLMPEYDRAGSRNIQVDTESFYLKGNFEYLEGDLRGDIGLRYVKTENASTGFSSIDLQNQWLHDIPTLEGVLNPNNPVCQASIDWGNARGLDTSDPNTVYTAPSGVSRSEAEAYAAVRDQELADRGHCYDLVFRDNRSQNRLAPQQPFVEDYDFAVTGSGESDLLLPSLNLNYDINDELVARFAVSKTMARPEMDSLQSAFRLRENVWRGTGNGTIRNPNLQPLESKNLDLSLEWYFDEAGGLLSAAFFRKDFENFEESETVGMYIQDVRGRDAAELEGITADDVLLATPDLAQCLPNRPHWWADPYADKYVDKCHELQVSRLINGKGAKVNGFEFGYQQNYTFLPGFLSGLGTAINATFQETKAERQEGTIEGTFLPALPLSRSPEKSFNATVFWEQDGHLVRLAYNYASDVLINRSFRDGTALWQEGSGTLDLSASYEVNDWLSFNFNAVNITDTVIRQYFTVVSNNTMLEALGLEAGGEGSAFDSATDRRTLREWNTGAIYRFGVRVKF
ncbi:TonB-dependent receptor [Agaribacter flavus]|uniref:TonB-dependent receptor n=1 Tax=Agaribacter flavus TaxID=1902781 RepID=A0ABV7FKE3_9ALTE